MLKDKTSRDDEDIMSDLMARAGVVAKRLLAERGLIYLEDLNRDECRLLLKVVWRQAASERFPDLEVTELHAEIDVMIDSMIFPQPHVPRSALN